MPLAKCVQIQQDYTQYEHEASVFNLAAKTR